MLAHKNPKLTILQIGAGNSPMAQAIVEILSDLKKTHGCFRYTQWDYTDTSGACLRTAQHQFKAEGERMRFLPLNIEEDPEGQGFESGAYDVVVAGAVWWPPWPACVADTNIVRYSIEPSIVGWH